MNLKKTKSIFKKGFISLLSLGMVVTTLSMNMASVAAEDTDSTESTTSVEYFTSTLYNWDEDAANKATAEADVADGSEVSYSAVSLSYNRNTDYSGYANNGYYYSTGGKYYLVTSLSATNNKGTTTWTIGYNSTSTTTTGNLTLYTVSTSYEGRGFYFTNGSNMASSVPEFSKWVSDNQNYMIYSGLAASKLSDSSNAPFNDSTVNAANLFATDGSNTSYTDVYTNVQVPFVYDSETGYYTLDSDANAVYFANGNAESGATMAIASLPAAHSYGNYYATGFLPFNAVSSNTTNYALVSGSSSDYTTGYTTSGSTVWGFGMVTSVDFQMTDDGNDANGDAITFEFSGDDDVWVYIDGYLVLDIGGTHDAITGTIDFSTGDVELTAGSYEKIGDIAVTGSVSTTDTSSSTLSQDNIYDVLGTTLTGFASSGNHTLTIYYMERGRGRSNCLIKFNLPQKDSVSVTKEISDYYLDADTYEVTTDEIPSDVMSSLNNIDFTFTLYNGEGKVVANANYSLYDSSGTFVQTGSTDANGEFTLKNGYTAVFNNVDLDSEGTWYVVENLDSTRWKTSTETTATINNNTSLDEKTTTTTSYKVNLTDDTDNPYIGSELSADSISYVFTNSYVKGTDPDVDVYDETIVLDYGLPVSVDVMANDNTTLYGIAIKDGSVTVGNETYECSLSLSITTSDNELTYGTAKVVDGQIVYTLDEDFCGIETIEYEVEATVYDITETDEDGNEITQNKTGSATGTLTIIPATLMYYEESFSDMVTYSDGNVKWTSTGTSATGYQETGFVGTTTDSTYGTDAVYLNETGDSYGTSMYADVSGSYGAAFEYDFTGTGTAILSRISTDSAYIQVTITHTDDNGNTVQDDRQYVDTRVVQNVSNNTTLYNIPVYNIDSLDYGTYHVYVYVYKANTTVYATYDDDGTQLTDTKSGESFYLDGIRVYQPMGTEDDNVTGYSTAASAYATDGEANVSIINIRAKIAADDTEGWNGEEFATLTDTNGNITDVDTYTAIGPNEELYLTANQEVSFTLVNWDSQSYKLYLGLKAPSGSTATVTIGSTTLTIKNSTVCYYDISSYVTVESVDISEDEDGSEMINVGTVTITGGDRLIALTNLKVTGVDAFELGYPEDVDDNGDGSNSISLASLDSDTLYLLPTTISLVADTDDEAEEAVVFTPELIKVVCNWASKTKKATVTVSTSTDVAKVTINGEEVTSKKVSNQLNWSKSYTKVTKGTTFEIVVYDADGNSSETYTVTAE